MAYEAILYRQEDGIGSITLHRPRSVNAISQQMLEELGAAVEGIDKDNKVKVFLITGAPRPDGRPCFSSGLDLKELAASDPHQGHSEAPVLDGLEGMLKFGEFEHALARLCRHIERLEKPSLAVIDGICTTGALELALACDFRFVAESAELSDFHIRRLGHIGGAGLPVRLPLLVGTSKAKELSFLGQPVDGKEAYRIGLANQVHPSEKLMGEALAFTRQIAGMNPLAIRMGKAVVDSTRSLDPDQALRYSYLCWTALLEATGGFQRARTFTERREGFTGQR